MSKTTAALQLSSFADPTSRYSNHVLIHESIEAMNFICDRSLYITQTLALSWVSCLWHGPTFPFVSLHSSSLILILTSFFMSIHSCLSCRPPSLYIRERGVLILGKPSGCQQHACTLASTLVRPSHSTPLPFLIMSHDTAPLHWFELASQLDNSGSALLVYTSISVALFYFLWLWLWLNLSCLDFLSSLPILPIISFCYAGVISYGREFRVPN